MVKTPTAATSPIRQKINDVKREIFSIKARIKEQDEQIAQFQEAVELIESNAKYTPQTGELVPFDQLKNLLAEQETEADRQAKLAVARQALNDCKASQHSSCLDLQNFNNYLSYLQSEEEWETEYARYTERYRSSFPLKSSLQKRQQEIDTLERDIINKKEILHQANEWLKAPSNAKPRYFVAPPLHIPESVVNYLPKAIPALEAQLKALQEKPITESPQYEKQFREYVKARVLLMEPLKDFLKAQSDYLAALGDLQLSLDQIPSGTISTNFENLGLKKVLLLDQDDVIRYA